MRIHEQIRRNSVALISLAVALSSLAYNTWRNEQTEANRNVRNAGVEVLLQLGRLDQIVFFSHYEMDEQRGSPREGWAVVLVIRDLGTLLPDPALASSQALYATWDENWSGLGHSDGDASRISDAIDAARVDVRTVLAALD